MRNLITIPERIIIGWFTLAAELARGISEHRDHKRER